MTAENGPSLDRAEIDLLLAEEDVGYLALSEGGQPYCVPLSYAFLDGRFVFHCALAGRKVDLVRGNPRCCFVVSRSLDKATPHRAEGRCSYRFESVIATGRARVVDDLRERHLLLAGFQGHFYRRLGLDPADDPVTPEAASRCGCIVIDVDTVTGRRKV